MIGALLDAIAADLQVRPVDVVFSAIAAFIAAPLFLGLIVGMILGLAVAP